MRNTLLGIKVIGFFAIIGPSINILIHLVDRTILQNIGDVLFAGLLSIIIGINILRRKDAARKFLIFMCYLFIVLYIIFAFLTPIFNINAYKDYQATKNLYDEKIALVAKLESETATGEKIIKAKKELSNLKEKLGRYVEFEKNIEKSNETFAINKGNLFYLFFCIIIIYYFKKPYVRNQFPS